MKENMDEIYKRCHDICYTIDNLNSRKQKAVNAILIGGLPKDDTDELIKRIEAFYSVRVRDLKEEFFKVHEENKVTAETPKDKTYYEFDFGACSITVDSDVFNKARYACNHGICICDECNLKDIPACICCDLEKKWQRGEYRIIHGKEE